MTETLGTPLLAVELFIHALEQLLPSSIAILNNSDTLRTGGICHAVAETPQQIPQFRPNGLHAECVDLIGNDSNNPLRSSAHPPIAVAVSGGSDSMALTLLAQEAGLNTQALTVDHQLRPNSAQEAAKVADWMKIRNIPHEILTWHHADPMRGNLLQAARNARYTLLSDYCQKHRTPFLLIGHTEDDQAETIALRQQRASGPVGLAGMSARGQWNGITILRPLLTNTREELRQYLHARQQPWIEDPSNENIQFDRIRIRKELAVNVTYRSELLALGKKMAIERQKIENAFAAFATQSIESQNALLQIDHPAFLKLPEEIALYAFARILCTVSGRPHPPRYAELQRLLRNINENSAGKATLGRCSITWDPLIIKVMLEFPADPAHIRRATPLVAEPFCSI